MFGARARLARLSLCRGEPRNDPPSDFAGSLRSLALWSGPAGGRSRYAPRQLVAPTHGSTDIAVDLKRRWLLREDASTSSTVMNSQRLSPPDGACSSRTLDFDVVSVAA